MISGKENEMIYKTTFKRYNFDFQPVLVQSADVVFVTDIPDSDETIEEFERVMWDAMWEQNSHWKDPTGPLKGRSGWSSVLGGNVIVKIG